MSPKFHPDTICRNATSEDPGAGTRALSKKVKNVVSLEDAEERREHAKSLLSQGHMMRVGSCTSDVWATAICRLGSDCL